MKIALVDRIAGAGRELVLDATEPAKTQIEAILAGDSRTLLASRDGHFLGAAAWSHLPWDSDLFGFPTGRVTLLIGVGDRPDTLDLLCRAVLDDAASQGVRHLTARVPSSDLAGIWALERAGFQTLDCLLTFSLDIDAPCCEPPDGVLVRSFRPGDTDVLCEIARTAYRHDRFHADNSLAPGTADRLHAEWIRNSCLGKAADHVLVAEFEGQVAGYVTCRVNQASPVSGTIVLVATAHWAQGRGIARRATMAAINWFQAQGAVRVEVGTQFRNIAAARLYESCGFRLTETFMSLRRTM